MTIKLNTKRLYANLLFAILWTGIGAWGLIGGEATWTNYLFLVLGTIYLLHFLHDLRVQYLQVDHGVISKNFLYGIQKPVKLKDIQEIQRIAGYYILLTPQRKFKIDPSMIAETSMGPLLKVLKELDIPQERTPFSQ